MLSLHFSGAVYPLVVVSDAISPALRDGPLYAIDSVPVDGGEAFPIWHAPLLKSLFPEVHPDAQAWIDWAVRRETDLADIRAGTHPMLAQLRAEYKWMTPWQAEAMAFCVTSPVAGIFFEPGMGKTAPMCALIQRSVKHAPGPTLVIGSGPDLLTDAWEPELASVAPYVSVCNLNNQRSPNQRIEPNDVYLVSRQALGYRQATIRDGLRALNVQRVIVDESYTMANEDTRLAGMLLNDWIHVPQRYLMSGLPAPMGAWQWWTQINFLAPGLLPCSRSDFLKAFFIKENNRYVPMKERYELLMSRISKVALFREQEGNLNIPGERTIERYCELPESPNNIRAAYEVTRDGLRAELNKMRAQKHLGAPDFTPTANNVFRRILALREMTSGYMKDEGGVWQLVSTHRFELLDRVLTEIGNHQAVIWMVWDADFRNLPKVLPHRAAVGGFIWGATPGKKYRQHVRNEFRDGNLQYMFTNPPCQRHGLTLFNPRLEYKCHNAVFFDYNYSLDEFEQAGKRLPRIGQTNLVTNWVLVCRNTIDEEVYGRLKQRRQDSDDMHEFLK